MSVRAAADPVLTCSPRSRRDHKRRCPTPATFANPIGTAETVGTATLASTTLPSGQFGEITSGNASMNGRLGVPTVVFAEQQAACHTPG